MPQNLAKLLLGVELETKHEPHPVAEGLEQGVLVGGREQQREISERDGLRPLARPRVQQHLLLVDSEVKGDLELLVQFVGFIKMHD